MAPTNQYKNVRIEIECIISTIATYSIEEQLRPLIKEVRLSSNLFQSWMALQKMSLRNWVSVSLTTEGSCDV